MARALIRPREQATVSGDGGLYFSSAKENIQFIRTGCTLLDCVLGGGWPLGRVVNIVGDKSTGKTLLAMEAIANFCRDYPDGKIWYNEAEAAFDEDYARALGIPFNNVTYIQDCTTVEEFFSHLDGVLDASATPKLYILDSLDSLSDKAEMKRGIDEASYGSSKARKLSEVFRRLTQDVKKANCCLIIISQVRDNIGVSFGEKHTRSGGKALDFYVSLALWLAHTGILKRVVEKVERPVGIKVKAKCKKNKVSLPFRECEFEISFGYGIEDEKASHEFLKAVGKPLTGKGRIHPDELSKLVVEEWYRIEKTFLPTRRKYGG